MRIISQNRLFDFPFDSTALFLSEKEDNGIIKACLLGDPEDAVYHMAEYPTHEDAIAAMGQMHDACRKNSYAFVFPQDIESKMHEDYKDEFSNLKFNICYLTDIKSRIENAKDYFYTIYHEEITICNNNYFETGEIIFRFADISEDRNPDIEADMAIIDFRNPMCIMADKITRNSILPEDIRVVDDRKFPLYDTRMDYAFKYKPK